MNIQLRRRQYRSVNRDPSPQVQVQTKLPKLMNFHHAYIDHQLTPQTRSYLPEVNTLPPSNRRKSHESMHFENRIRKEDGMQKNRAIDKSHLSIKTNQETNVTQGEKEASVAEQTPSKILDIETPSIMKIDIARDLETSYNQYLYNKMLEKERLQSARLKVVQIEEEKKEKLRKKFDEKEKKKQFVLSNLLQRQQKKMKEVEEMRRDKQQKLEEIETELSQTNSERFKNLMKKLERSSSKKKELDMQKSQRLFKMNTLLSEKQHSILERKDQGSNMVYSNLLGIENRLTQTSERKKRFIEEKINRSQKYLSFVDEKQKKANEVKASLQQSLVQKVVNKLVKVRSKSAMLPLKHADNDEYNKSNFQMDHRKRLELFNQKKLEEENLRLNKYKEKETRLRNKSEQRREELSKFTQEKRMEWKQKLNYIQNNKKISSQETNKKFDDMLVSYRNKIENILSTKIKRRERLEKLDKNFALGLLDKSSILTAPNMLYHTSK